LGSSQPGVLNPRRLEKRRLLPRSTRRNDRTRGMLSVFRSGIREFVTGAANSLTVTPNISIRKNQKKRSPSVAIRVHPWLIDPLKFSEPQIHPDEPR
jgi:hypothetical protein